MTLRAWKQNSTGTIHFIYDGARLLAEFDDSGTLQDIYAWGAAGLAERSLLPSSGLYYAYSFDPSGNLVQRHSASSVINYHALADYTAAYDAFGAQLGAFNSLTQKEPGGQDSVGFGGQWGYYTDNETYSTGSPGMNVAVTRMPLVLCGLRYYDPQVGRFLNRDPEGYDGGIDLYAYCRNNPINYFDPLGLQGDEDPDEGILPKNWNGQQFYYQPWKRAVNKGATITRKVLETGSSFLPGVPQVEALYGRDESGHKVSTIDKLLAALPILGILGPVVSDFKYSIKAFKTFEELKEFLGPASQGRSGTWAWHHIVEENPGNIKRFGAEAIHSTWNIVALPHGRGSIHARISGFYSSIQPAITGSRKLTVRKWLKSQSYEYQYQFGIWVIQHLGGTKYLSGR